MTGPMPPGLPEVGPAAGYGTEVIAAERAMLGGMMLSREAIEDVLEVLSPQMMDEPGAWARPAHANIAAAIVKLHHNDQPVNAVTVLGQLQAEGNAGRCGGAPYLYECIASVPSAANAGYYARRMVLPALLLRRLDGAGMRIRQAVAQPGVDPLEVQEVARRDIEAVLDGATRDDLEPVDELFWRVLGEIESPAIEAPGIPTGFSDLDAVLGGGLKPGRLYVVAARPGMGKSTLATDVIRHACVRGKRIIDPATGDVTFDRASTVLFSLEMTSDEVMAKVIAAEADVLYHPLTTHDLSRQAAEKIAAVSDRITTAPLVIDSGENCTVSDIRLRYATERRKRNDVRLIIVDYLQLMKHPGRWGNRQEEVSDLSRELKLLARSLRVPVVVLAQLNRGPEARSDKRPELADLRESGAIEQNADAVILMHREDYYEAESPRAGEADLLLKKNRHGPATSVTVAFQGHKSRFVDMAPDSLRQPFHFQAAGDLPPDFTRRADAHGRDDE